MTPRLCLWCEQPFTPGPHAGHQRHCSKRCRQRYSRAHAVSLLQGGDAPSAPLRIGYGDPPFPGMSRKYYRDQPTFAGEVDHAALIAKLVTFDGWALSTSERAVRDLYPLCPEGTRLSPWVKPHGVPPTTYGPHNVWEAILYVPARRLRPGFPNALRAMPARGGGTLPGRKPRRFWQFLFRLLGMLPGDDFVDFFPGSGAGDRHWRAAGGVPSRPSMGDEQLDLLPALLGPEPLLAAAAERKALSLHV